MTSNVVRAAIAANVPVYLNGAPGSGKSTSILAMLAEDGYFVERIDLSLASPADVGGYPYADDGVTRFQPIYWVPSIIAADAQGHRTAIVLDEVNNCAPSVQKVACLIAFDRRVGDQTLPAETRMVLIGNPAEYGGLHDLDPALSNRCAHERHTPEASEYAEGLRTAWGASTPMSDAEQRARDTVASLVVARPTLLHQYPTDEGQRCLPWPSPRSWEQAAKLLATCDDLSGEDATRVLIATVGRAAAAEYIEHVGQKLPDPEALLTDPSTDPTFDPDRPDRTRAILDAVAKRVEADPDQLRYERALALAAVAADIGHAVTAIPAVRALVGTAKDHGLQAAIPALRPFASALQEALS